MNIRGALTMAAGLLVAVSANGNDVPDLVSVSGTIQVTNTKLKTEGAKSDKEVIVYLERVDGAKMPPPIDHAVLDQSRLVFIPHVMAIQAGTTVDFVNSDTTDHNVFCVDECCKLVEDITKKKPAFLDLGNFPGGETASHTFSTPGEGVMLCKLHPEMAAYIIVVDTPYFTVAEIDGTSQTAGFTIENVPPGNYLLKTWNKRCEPTEQVITVGAGEDAGLSIDLQRKERKRKRK